MQSAINFTSWFLNNIPSFLTTEPMASFIGFVFLAFTIKVFRDLCNVG